MRYLVVIEKAGRNWSAYAPDVPGCVATGKTPAKTRAAIAGALSLHLHGLAQDGQPAPSAQALADHISV